MTTISAVVPAFGSNRTNAKIPAKLLKGSGWVGVFCAGGISEVPHFDARTIVVTDAHWWIINLCQVIKDPQRRELLISRCDRTAFHPVELAASQQFCRQHHFDSECWVPDFEAAVHYFNCAWMNRSAQILTRGEFRGSLPVRWTASGGDSSTRYRNAVKALRGFEDWMRKCNFVCQDCFEFLRKVKDRFGHALYGDPPWVIGGEAYVHSFTEKQHRQLAETLTAYRCTRIVVRYGDCELIRELYPADQWRWHQVESKKQSGATQREVFLEKLPA